MYALLLGLSVLPVVVLLYYIYLNDKYEKEPLGMLVKALCFGALSVVPAIVLEQLMGQLNVFGKQPVAAGLFDGFCVAGFCEELSKLALLWLCVWHNRNFNEYFDGIVYAACVALGFAGVENILYVFGSGDFATAFHTGITRAILSVPGHFLFGVVMGYYFALAKFEKRRRALNLLLALLMPLLLHGTFDALLMIPENMGEGAGALSTIMFVVFIWFDIRLWKIGRKRLALLQEKTRQQTGGGWQEETSRQDKEDKNDPFSGMDWDV